ncbi:MAG TPA: nucleoside monophosphate kinase [Bryobacteraceae bacterium]|nr:nucleoside monophosphate kinase [Bryobacteraceae bacterium]
MTRRILALGVLAAALSAAADRPYVIVLIGPTGSGKTTQADFLKRRYGLPTISIDELIHRNRAELNSEKTPGINDGSPQQSLGINELVRDRVKQPDTHRGFVLDGYPASKDQADYLGKLLENMHLPAPVIIQLDVPDAIARQRLARRRRADDTPAQIEQRLKDYHREMDMVRAYYPQANIWTVDGTRTPSEVSKTIVSILEDELPKRTPTSGDWHRPGRSREPRRRGAAATVRSPASRFAIRVRRSGTRSGRRRRCPA